MVELWSCEVFSIVRDENVSLFSTILFVTNHKTSVKTLNWNKSQVWVQSLPNCFTKIRKEIFYKSFDHKLTNQTKNQTSFENKSTLILYVLLRAIDVLILINCGHIYELIELLRNLMDIAIKWLFMQIWLRYLCGINH